MGDRCYAEITIRKDSPLRKKVEELFVGDEIEENKHTICLCEYEANYGYLSELEALAKEGLVAVGTNTAGAEYPDGAFVLVDNKAHFIDVVNGQYAIITDDEGNPLSEYQKQLKDFIKAHKKAEKILNK